MKAFWSYVQSAILRKGRSTFQPSQGVIVIATVRGRWWMERGQGVPAGSVTVVSAMCRPMQWIHPHILVSMALLI
eukprot:6289240-Karenia_brevis.AAC.1